MTSHHLFGGAILPSGLTYSVHEPVTPWGF
jgi:hypothetical protein